MNLNEFFKYHSPILKEHIIKEIESYEATYRNKSFLTALNLLKKSSISGKMIRGLTFLSTASMFGSKINTEMYYVAVSIEILQTGLLIHDDIIDRDLLRRGEQSVFSYYIEKSQNKDTKEATHFGTSMAICVGDIAFFLLFKILAKRVADKKISASMCSFLSGELMSVGLGQMLDVEYSEQNSKPKAEDILEVYKLKTSGYSFVLPLVLGSIYFNKNCNEVFSEIGTAIGNIFQLRDDEIGIFGKTKKIGKEAGSDIRENKQTFIKNALFECATSRDKTKLLQIFGNKRLTQGDISFVQKSIIKYKINEKVAEIVKLNEAICYANIKKLSNKNINTQYLEDLLRYVYNRKF